MNVLLTGSTGYIGRRLKQRLLNDENINLKLLVRNKKSLRKNRRLFFIGRKPQQSRISNNVYSPFPK